MQTLTWMLVGTTNHCMFSHQSEVNKCFEISTQEGGNSSTEYVVETASTIVERILGKMKYEL